MTINENKLRQTIKETVMGYLRESDKYFDRALDSANRFYSQHPYEFDKASNEDFVNMGRDLGYEHGDNDAKRGGMTMVGDTEAEDIVNFDMMNHNGSTSDDYRNYPNLKQKENDFSWEVYDDADRMAQAQNQESEEMDDYQFIPMESKRPRKTINSQSLKKALSETIDRYLKCEAISKRSRRRKKLMNENEEYLSSSWLNGKYDNINGYNVEIDSSYSIASFEDVNDPDSSYFFQGDEADTVIDEISAIYNQGDLKQDEAIAQWINLYL